MIGAVRDDTKKSNRTRVAIILAAALTYALFYFVLCGLPVMGVPTFRIDYYWASVTRGDELKDLSWPYFTRAP